MSELDFSVEYSFLPKHGKCIQSELNKISQRKKDLTFGYIKEAYENKNNHIPTVIRHLALFYHHVNNDSFDYARTNWLLEIGNDCIKQEIRLLDSSSVNSYLKNIEYWRFKNKSECTNDADMIGIKNIESELRLRRFFDSPNQ